MREVDTTRFLYPHTINYLCRDPPMLATTLSVTKWVTLATGHYLGTVVPREESLMVLAVVVKLH